MPILPGYAQFGGHHPETAALANCLAQAGYRAPHTGQPYSEAMVLGVGGGLGAGYILWEFKAHQVAVLVVAFSHNWQYPQKFLETAAGRLNAATTVKESGGRGAAADHLQAALANGQPAIAWVDLANLPYLQLPESLKGHLGHLVAICGQEDGAFWVDDRAARPFRVTGEALAEARGRITSYKNRLLLLAPPAEPPDLTAAVEAGLRDCVANLSAKSDSFSLPTLRKWARLMTDTKNPKGWPVVFKTRRGLYTALKSVFENIALTYGRGGGLRGLYADFLDEAAGLLSRPALTEAAAAYRALTERWAAVAAAALPDSEPALAETKALLRRKHALLMQQGQAGVDRAEPVTAELAALGCAASGNFPLDDTAVASLFAEIGERVRELYEAEVRALEVLRQGV